MRTLVAGVAAEGSVDGIVMVPQRAHRQRAENGRPDHEKRPYQRFCR